MNPKSNPFTIKHHKHWLYLFLINLLIPFKLDSQTVVIDTLYQSNNEIYSLNYSNGCIYWNEFVNGEFIINRIYNDVFENRKLPLEYSSCNYGDGLYAYGDFLYMATTNGPGQTECKQGFLWGEDSFILDTLDIGSICKAYQNIILTEDETLIDINTGMKTILNLENAQYRYSSSNICSLNESVVNIKAFKYNKNNNEYLGQTIIQYDLNQATFEEVYFSENFLHFTNEFSKGKSIVFTEEHVSGDRDSMMVYYYNGIDLKSITQRNITNGYMHSYLDGVVYSSSDTLFYWEDGHTSILSDQAFRMAIDDCQIAWFSRYGNNNVDFKVFNGTTYLSKSFIGNPAQQSLTLFDENKFIFAPIGDSGESEYYIFKGEFGLTCSASCEDTDIEIASSDNKSYLKARKIESISIIDQENVRYKAQEAIHLLPGFSVTNNSEFIAKLEICNNQTILSKKENEQEKILNYSENLSKKEELNKFARIEQNIPNPYRSSTLIEYFIPENSKTAKIKLYNFVGLEVKEISLNSIGANKVNIQMNNLAHGIYYYSLEIDGKIIDTKKMILIK